MSQEKRSDGPTVTVRLTKTEHEKVLKAASIMGMDVAESFRKAWASGISTLLDNEIMRRIAEIDDVKIERKSL